MILLSKHYKGKLIPQEQPSRWSCMATAFAICLNISVEDIIKKVGHDGSEILRPELPEPLKRRGFHPQELYKICYENSKSVMVFETQPHRIDEDSMIPLDNDEEYLYNILKGNIGVLGGKTIYSTTPHMVAWDGEIIIDPKGTIYDLKYFHIDYLFLITTFPRGNNDTISTENSKSYKAKVSSPTFS